MGRRQRASLAAMLAIGIAGCAHAAPSSHATALGGQRACVAALDARLRTLAVDRIDAFFSATLNGLVVCDAESGLAYLPTRDVSLWLEHANGRPHAMVLVPAQPPEIGKIPTDASARVAYQLACTRYMRRYLPASILRNGDDPDTAAAKVFDGMEECDAAAGFATISREELARIIKAKHLE